jgi:hypothetical protein
MTEDARKHTLSPPLVWPQSDLVQPDGVRPAGPKGLENPKSIFGIVHAPSEGDVFSLLSLTSRKRELALRLIVTVSPACATRSEQLEMLYEKMLESDGRLMFRVLALGGADRPPVNCICTTDSESEEPLLFVGPGAPFGAIDWQARINNFLWKPEPLLLESFRRWFDETWKKSSPLNKGTLGIPALVPAEGSIEAAELWQQYLLECAAKVESSNNGDGPQAQEPGEAASITEALGITKLDDLAEQISRIFEKGEQVTIDKQTRIPPFDAPIKAEWFGVESLRHVGAVQRRVQYRVSAVDEKTLRVLNNKRKLTKTVLDHLSFPLSEGVRWMPKEAHPFFEGEMQRVNAEAQQSFKDAVGDNAEPLVESQRKRLYKDANQMYRDFHPDENLPADVFENIISDLKSRLLKASSGVLLPQISRLHVGFQPAKDSQWQTVWGMALTLLLAIAEFPRKALTDPYFLRGTRVKADQLLIAMDVCGDYLVERNKVQRVDQLASEEIALLNDISESQVENRSKCEAVLCLLRGEGAEAVRERLEVKEQGSEGASDTTSEKNS